MILYLQVILSGLFTSPAQKSKLYHWWSKIEVLQISQCNEDVNITLLESILLKEC